MVIQKEDKSTLVHSILEGTKEENSNPEIILPHSPILARSGAATSTHNNIITLKNIETSVTQGKQKSRIIQSCDGKRKGKEEDFNISALHHNNHVL